MARRRRRTRKPDYELIRQAVRTRLEEIREYLHPIAQEVSMEIGYPIPMRCAWAGTRYVGRCLYNLDDPSAIQNVDINELLMLLKEGIMGAARYTMEE